MSVGFGFSVGDFIAAVELVSNVIDALRESGEASNRYHELVRQLDSLESVLLRVRRLEIDETQHAEYIALQQAASQCQTTIDEFWKKIKKYQPALDLKGTSRLKESWMKVRWAVCKKEDVNTFKADIKAHTESIQLLLTTIQMSRVKVLEKENDRKNLSLANKIQAGYFEVMKKVIAISQATSIGIEQGKQLISATSKILEMNVQIFQAILNLQNFITHIPAQVERQQPVYLIDALGKQSPFHLEFIRSAEALVAVLETNFSKTGHTRKRIARGEFIIQDSLKKRDINIFNNWDKCFYPGQRVEMSVVFQRRWQAGNMCPGCGTTCDGSGDIDVKCPSCEITFRRIIEIIEDEPLTIYNCQVHEKPTLYGESLQVINDSASLLSTNSTIESPVQISTNSKLQKSKYQIISKQQRKREYARDSELELELDAENIRRVHIRTVSRGVTDRFKVMFGYFEEDGKPESALCCGFRTNDDEGCLIIQFEDNNSNTLCDTIDQQSFKLGGLFQTDLVKAESINEETEETDRQITWMDEDEVQMYLRFKSKNNREVIWDFIVSAQSRQRLRRGWPLDPPPDQDIMVTEPASENFEDNLFSMPLDYQHLDFMPEEGMETQIEDDNLDPEWYSLFPIDPLQSSIQNQASNSLSFLPGDLLDDVQSPHDKIQDLDLYENAPSRGHLTTSSGLFPGHNSESAISIVRSIRPRRQESPLPPVVLAPNDTISVRRARNTLAARHSRHRKIQQFEDLENKIAKLKKERDYWKKCTKNAMGPSPMS